MQAPTSNYFTGYVRKETIPQTEYNPSAPKHIQDALKQSEDAITQSHQAKLHLSTQTKPGRK